MFSRSLWRLALPLVLACVLCSGAAVARSARLARQLFTNVQVSHDAYAAHSEPMVAENPANPDDLVAGSKFFTDPAHYRFKIGSYYSIDGGRSWHDNGLLPGFGAYPVTSDISFAFSSSGLVYAAVLACEPLGCPAKTGSSGIFVLKSRDGGRTWSRPVAAFLDTTGDTFSDKPWIAVDTSRGRYRGTVYVAWNLDGNTDATDGKDPGAAALAPRLRTRVDPNLAKQGIVVARSTDYGRSFSAPVTVLPFTQDQAGLGAIPAVGPDGTLSVGFIEYHSQGTATVYDMENVTSTNGGRTFSSPRVAASDISPEPSHLPNSTFRNFSLPTLAVSPRDGTLVLAWSDTRNGDADIYEVRSRNRGRSWSVPLRVNHDRLRNGKDQFMPACAASPDGVFTCSWFDRRHDPNDRLIDVDIAQSRNDGASFGKNLRVTAHSWDPATGAPLDGNGKETFIGDYQGLAVDDAAVHPLWNDTQDGKSQQIRTATLPIRVFLK